MDVVKEYGLNGNLVFSETMWFDFEFLVFLTSHNNIKKVKKDLLLKFKKFPTTIMGLEKWEKIIKVIPIKADDKIWVISEMWKILIFRQKFVRPMWKTAGWVKAIELMDGDNVADLFVYKDESFIFIHDDKNGKMVSVEDLLEQKARGEMKRAQSWVVAASVLPGQKLRGAIALDEWSVYLAMKNGRIDIFDSEKMDLKLPEDPLTKITNGEIVKMRRAWHEKEEKRSDGEEEQEEDQEESEE